MHDEALFELSRSAQLNEVIQAARAVLEGRGVVDDLKTSLKQLNTLRREMRSMFRRGLTFQEDSPSLKDEKLKVEKYLERLREGIDETYRYTKDLDGNHIAKGLPICREAFVHLFMSFDRIKELEEGGERYSESPFQNELMRVGYGVLKGTIRPDALKTRLDGLYRYARSLYESFDGAVKGPREQQFYETNGADIKKTLKSYVRGLEETGRYFRDSDPSHIRAGLEMTAEAAKQLLEYQKELIRLNEEPEKKLCFRCGSENEIWSHYCSSCNAAFPSFETAGESSVEFVLDTQGAVKTQDHVDTEFTRRVIDAISRVRGGTLSADGFRHELDDMEGKAENAKKEKAKLAFPTELVKADPSQAELFEQIEQLTTTGIEEIMEGLRKMRQYLEWGDDTALTFGLETVLCGADRLFMVQMMSQEMEKAQKSS
jgi:hypothetical protein